MLPIKRLADLSEKDRAHYGAKAWNLAQLAKSGLPVPRGFVLAFETGHAPKLSADERRALVQSYAALCREADDADVSVAVRSSAVGEDGTELSFAGQYATCLSVRGEGALADAVEECIASCASDRATAYLLEAGAGLAGIGVLVQCMVPADFAGVCFTRSPVEPDVLAVEVVEGLGNELVSGMQRPARVSVAREKLALREGDDPTRLLERFGSARVLEIARLSLEAEAHFGFPVDVEWAWGDGQAWLLQSRPITASTSADQTESIRCEQIEQLSERARRAGQVLVWSDFSVADMFPRPSPLGLEILSGITAAGGSFDRAMRALALRFPLEDRNGPIFDVICGRTYLNLNTLVGSVDESLPVALDPRRLKDHGITLDPEHLPMRLAWRGWRAMLRLPFAVPRWLFATPFRFIRARRNFDVEFREQIEPKLAEEAATLRAQPLDGLSNAELWQTFLKHVRRFHQLAFYHQLTDSIALPTHFFLRCSLRRLYGEKMEAAELELTTGLLGNFNTETNLDLARVAAGELSLAAYLARYGHRGNPDYEISAARWREEPERIEAIARTIARSGADPRRQFEKQIEIRTRAQARFSADLRADWLLRPWRSVILQELDYYQRYSPLREGTQAACFRWIELARLAAIEAGRRIGMGQLVFELHLSELEALLQTGTTDRLLARARVRRRRRRSAQQIYLPHVLRSDDLEAIGRVPELDPDTRELRGQMVSAGAVRGRARVVQSLDEAIELQPGEILVTAAADPAWTPLFLVAGGLVLEQGGLLSHPAIVAREYGLPALVNVPHATRTIRTGQEILVDADGGRVVIEGA